MLSAITTQIFNFQVLAMQILHLPIPITESTVAIAVIFFFSTYMEFEFEAIIFSQIFKL